MQVLIELDAETLRRLELVAPARSRKRSAFIRAAIQKALWQLEEDKTRQAYLAEPDTEPVQFDPGEWELLAYGGFDAPSSESSRKPLIQPARRAHAATKQARGKKRRTKALRPRARGQ